MNSLLQKDIVEANQGKFLPENEADSLLTSSAYDFFTKNEPRRLLKEALDKQQKRTKVEIKELIEKSWLYQ